MPDIVIKITREDAADLFTMIELTGGPYKAARSQVQKAIAVAWPEIMPEPGQDPIITAAGLRRPLPLTSKQQRALAEGFFAFTTDPATKGQGFTKAMAMAEVCRVSGWVQKHLDAQPMPEMEDALDDEPDLLDSAPAEAATAPAGGTVPFRPRDPSGAKDAIPEAAAVAELPASPFAEDEPHVPGSQF